MFIIEAPSSAVIEVIICSALSLFQLALVLLILGNLAVKELQLGCSLIGGHLLQCFSAGLQQTPSFLMPRHKKALSCHECHNFTAYYIGIACLHNNFVPHAELLS
jgi:hypothetical protein